ncbi:PD40 domain-containing protein [candidate division KSB1 bacterium]|nr:PD40 domain-containing protein [candidate division KSB1 bacterium]MBL7092948.1 PD40 domain-containing protein [candidate division KSB1 bacterium]
MKTKLILSLIISLVFVSLCFAQTPSQLFQQALLKENGEGDLKAAVEIYEKIVGDTEADRSLRAKALLHVGICWEKMGKETAEKTYKRIISEFADQAGSVIEAKTRLSNLQQNDHERSAGLSLTKVWSKFGIVPKNLRSISPDGKFISATHQSNGFCLVDLDAKKIKYLTDYKEREKELYEKNPSQAKIDSFYNSEKLAAGSAWSKDGKRFVYTWCNWSGKDSELRIMTVDGKIEKTFSVFKNMTWPIVEDWASDGENVLLTAMTEEGESSLITFNLLNQTIKFLKKIDQKEVYMHARFSPDGQFVAYDVPSANHNGKKDIYLLDVKNKRETLLIQNTGDDQLLGWMPKGGRILFASDRSGSFDAWSIKVKEGLPDGEPVFVKKDVGKIYPLGISKRGTFYYAYEFKAVDVYLTHLSEDGKKIDKDPVRIADRYIGTNRIPSWSPDGTKIAYLSKRGLQRDDLLIVIHTIKTKKRKKYQLKFKELQSINWSLDGKFLLLTGIDGNEQAGIFQFNLTSGKIQSLYIFPEKELKTSWAAQLPGGNKIIFVHRPSSIDP